MQRREGEPNPRPIPTSEMDIMPGYTTVGTVLKTSQGTWRYTLGELVQTGRITKSQYEQLSRASRDVAHVGSMSEATVEQFAIRTSSAISEHVGQRYQLGENVQKLREQLEDKLRNAIDQDKQNALEQPLAMKIAKKLSQLTGQSVSRVQFAIEGTDSLEEFLTNLQQLPPSPQK